MREGCLIATLGVIATACAACSSPVAREDAPAASTGKREGELRAGESRNRISLEFEGNESLSRLDLQTALSALVADLARAGVDATSVEDAVYELGAFYRAQGFPEPRVRAAQRRDGDRITLSFTVVEGRRRHVAGLSVRGNESIETGEIESCFVWVQKGTFGSLARHVLGLGSEVLGLQSAIYTEASLRTALACIETVYRLEGFHFVTTGFEAVESEPGAVEVAVEIEEGPRVRLQGPVEIVGARAFSTESLTAVLGLGERDVFVPRLPLVLEGRLLDHYRTRGYLFAKVDVERQVTRDPPRATLRIVVSEGPLTRVRDVRVEGREQTWRSVVDRYLKLRSGEVYDADLVRQSTRSLLRSGLFDTVTIESSRIEGSDDQVDLVVRLREKARYRISALAGWGSWEQLRGAVLLENTNVLGAGHRAALESSVSLRHRRFDAHYSIPYVFHEDLSFDGAGYYEFRENPSYTAEETGAEPGFGQRWTDTVRTRVFHSLRQSEVRDARGSLPRELQDDVFVSAANFAVLVDDRSSFINPSRGSSHRFRLEYATKAFGSELDFLRPTLSTTWILPLVDELRLVTAGETGVIFRTSDTESIPLQERFFSGGETSIRSYRQDDAGPKIGGQPIGGEAFVTGHVELRYPLEPVSFLDGLDGAVFADLGTVNIDADDYGGGRWLFALGFGLRYNTPIGPLRTDFAFNPDRRSGEDLFVFHFGLGYPF